MSDQPRTPPASGDEPLDAPSAAEARAQLAAAGRDVLMTDADRRVHALFAAGVGVAVAIVLVLCWWTATNGNKAGMALSLIGYGVVLAFMFVVKGRARSIPRGFGRVYNAGFVPTMTLYAASIAWIFGHQSPWPSGGVVAALAVITALPSIVAAVVIARLGRA